MIEIPILVTIILLALGIIGIFPIWKALAVVKRANTEISAWPSSKPESVVSAVFRTVSNLVNRGEPAAGPEICEAALDQVLPSRLAFSRFMAQASVYIGLGGALLGLSQSIRKIRGPQVRTMAEIDTFVKTISEVLQNFSGAFYCALAGIFVTVVLNALLTSLDGRFDATIHRLESLLRSQMLEKAGAGKRSDPAFDALKEVAVNLNAMFNRLEPALENVISRLEHTSKGLVEMIDAASHGLGLVKDEFLEARNGFSEALSEGAKAIEESSARIGSTLAEAATSAAEQISSSTRDGAEVIKLEIQNALATQKNLEEVSVQLASVISRSEEYLKSLNDILGKSDDWHARVLETETSLRQLAEAQKVLGQGIRGDLKEANREIVEQLTVQSSSMIKAHEQMEETLQSHTNFIQNLSSTVSRVPELIMGPKVQKTIESAFSKVLEDLDSRDKNIESLAGAINDVNQELQALNQISNQSGDTFVSRLNRLESAISKLSEVVGNNNNQGQFNEVNNNLNQLLKDVRELKERKTGIWPFRG